MKKSIEIFFKTIIGVSFLATYGCANSPNLAGSSQIKTYIIKCKVVSFDSFYQKLVYSKQILKPDSLIVQSIVDSINLEMRKPMHDSAYVRFLRKSGYNFNESKPLYTADLYFKQRPHLVYDKTSKIIFNLDTSKTRTSSNEIGLILRDVTILPDFRQKNWEMNRKERNKIISLFEKKILPYFNACEDKEGKVF